MPGDQEGPSQGVLQTGEQPDFFRQPISVHPDEVDAEPKRFGRGRPKGSRNRTSDDRARLILQICGDPVLARARIAAMSLLEIKQMLGCTRDRAYEVWKEACNDLAPYVASKLPLAVAVSGKVTTLNLTVPAPDGVQLGGPDAIAALFAQGLARAAEEGFVVPALPAPADQENAEETDG